MFQGLPQYQGDISRRNRDLDIQRFTNRELRSKRRQQELVQRGANRRNALLNQLRALRVKENRKFEQQQAISLFKSNLIQEVAGANCTNHELEDLDHFLEEVLIKDIRQREEELFNEWHANMLFEEENWGADEFMRTKNISEDSVECPVCKDGYLEQVNMSTIVCKCGLRLSLGTDPLTIDDLKKRLQFCFIEHAKVCAGSLEFAIKNQFGISCLMVGCRTCQKTDVVI